MDEKSLSHTSWNCKYHIVLVLELQISHSTGAKVSQKGNLREIKKRYWKNPENARPDERSAEFQRIRRSVQKYSGSG